MKINDKQMTTTPNFQNYNNISRNIEGYNNNYKNKQNVTIGQVVNTNQLELKKIYFLLILKDI